MANLSSILPRVGIKIISVKKLEEMQAKHLEELESVAKETARRTSESLNKEFRETILNLENLVKGSEKQKNDSFYESLYESYFTQESPSKHVQETIKYAKAKGYLTIYNSPLEREQSDEVRKYAQDISYIRAFEDPIIGAIPDSLQRFVLGRGIKFKCPNEDVQNVLDVYWKENNMEMFLKKLTWLLIVESEFFPIHFISDITGEVRTREVQPSEIESIETDPDDKSTIFSYKRSYLDESGALHTKYYADISYYTNSDIINKTKMSNFEKEPEWQGRYKLIQFIKLMKNREIRGRVFLERVLRWAEFYKNWIIDRAIINHEKGRVVWILELKGTREDVWERYMPSPAGGTTKISTPDRVWKPVNASIGADDAKEDGLFLLYQVAAGAGMPIHVLTQRTSEQVYSCHSEDTEILTSLGWKKYNEIDKNDLIGTVNPETLKFEWQPIIEKFVYDYDGELYHIKSKGTDAFITPSHKVFIQNLYRNKKWRLVGIDSLDISRFNVMCSLDWDDNQVLDCKSVEVPSFLSNISKETWLKFLGNYINHNHIEYISINKELQQWIENNIEIKNCDKRIPSFIFKLPKEELKIFFKTLTKYDETTSSCYITTSKQLAEDILLLGLRLGLRTYITEENVDTKDKSDRTTLYYVRISKHQKETLISSNKNNIIKEPYQGKVWCVEVQNHTMITRRNGKIAIHGNSIRASDSPFSQLILDFQDTLCDGVLRPIFKLVIRSMINASSPRIKLDKRIKIRKYVQEYLKDVFRSQFDRYLDGNLPDYKMLRTIRTLLESTIKDFQESHYLKIAPEISHTFIKKCKEIESLCIKDSIHLLESTIEDSVEKPKLNNEILKKAFEVFENGIEIEIDTENIPVEIVFPDMVKENQLESTRILEIHRKLGIVSKTTASAKAGYNPEQEKYLLDTEMFEPRKEKKGSKNEPPKGNDSNGGTPNE